jgi:hypothetical protein
MNPKDVVDKNITLTAGNNDKREFSVDKVTQARRRPSA